MPASSVVSLATSTPVASITWIVASDTGRSAQAGSSTATTAQVGPAVTVPRIPPASCSLPPLVSKPPPVAEPPPAVLPSPIAVPGTPVGTAGPSSLSNVTVPSLVTV